MESYPEEFRKVYADYILHKQREECPRHSMQQIKRCLSLFYGYLFTERRIERHSDIRKNDIKDFTRFLVDLKSGNGEKGGAPLYSPASVNRRLSDLKMFLDWLSNGNGGICPGLSAYARGVRKEDHITRNILSRKEIVKLFNVKAETKFEFMIKTICALLYGSGMRIGEALSLKMKDIDLEKKEAVIYETKTNTERTVQTGEVAAEYIKLYLENVRGKILHGRSDRQKVFISIYEKSDLSPCSVNLYLKKFCKKAGIRKDITCHSFRHSFGTHLMESGAGIKQAAELLGHKDLLATERYTRLNPEHLRTTILKYHPLERDRGKAL